MKRIRAKFIKGQDVKFLSHLDILRTFGRALKRSHIPVAYSQGFNPHPIISFALPLSVGTTSEGELVDIDIEGEMKSEEFVEKINKGLPKELEVISAEEVDAKSNIMALIKSAKYKVMIYGENFENISNIISDFKSKLEINVTKETKKGNKEVNIKNAIKGINVIESTDKMVTFIMVLDAGSESNLKPELVIDALVKYYGLTIKDIDIHRLELYY